MHLTRRFLFSGAAAIGALATGACAPFRQTRTQIAASDKTRVWLDGNELLASDVEDQTYRLGPNGHLTIIVRDAKGDIFASPNDEVVKAVLYGRVDMTYDGSDLSAEAQAECASLYRVVNVDIGGGRMEKMSMARAIKRGYIVA